jgi:hypothetical protein
MFLDKFIDERRFAGSRRAGKSNNGSSSQPALNAREESLPSSQLILDKGYGSRQRP